MKKKIKSVLIIVYAILLNLNTVHASGAGQIYNFSNNDTGGLISAASYIAGFIVYIGIAISVGVLIIKGIKFITSSPQGKADVKKELIPWAIGLVLLLTFQIIAQSVANFSQSNVNTL